MPRTRRKGTIMSPEVQNLIEQRQSLINDQAALENLTQINKEIRRQHRIDKRRQQMDMVDKDLDVRDVWCGIRRRKGA
eukprot:9127156-Prorocentrum_lima.AAC.1